MAEVMTVSEAARELNVAIDTVRDWADRGRLPVQRTAGGLRIFRRADVERVQLERQIAARDARVGCAG